MYYYHMYIIDFLYSAWLLGYVQVLLASQFLYIVPSPPLIWNLLNPNIHNGIYDHFGMH